MDFKDSYRVENIQPIEKVKREKKKQDILKNKKEKNSKDFKTIFEETRKRRGEERE